MKVLSPAGDFESLKMAVINGADEVYLGVKDFNARNNITGFDLSTLKQAVDFAHIYNVRVFLAVNILFDDYEIIPALNLIVGAYNLGVDAFIIQDLGLISLIKKYYPQIEVHASTQMGLHNYQGVKVAESLGVKRVVLSRETTLDEIDKVNKASDVEIEFFVQGALCVSFSGNCYLSSYECDASGNRGKCKQLCRLPYTLKYENKTIKQGYLLSAKDFCMLDRLKDLEQAGVDSLKIEGRARRPYYVGVATKTYRQAVDNLNYDKEELKLAFNRGYTEGYFNGNAGIISNLQNHIGIEIGEVKKVNYGKKFNEIFISSNTKLTAKSSFKFYRNGEEIATISAYDLTKVDGLYRITTTQKVEVGDTVNIISDYEKEVEIANVKRKRKLKILFTAIENECLNAEINIDGDVLKFYGEVCDVAKNAPLTVDEVKQNFKKSEYFEAELVCEIGNVFVPKQKLNEFRRGVYEKAYEFLTRLKHQPLKKEKIEKQKLNVERLKDFQVISNLNEKFEKENIIFCPNAYMEDEIVQFMEKCGTLNKKPVLNLPNFATSKDVEFLKTLVEKLNVAVVINNLYAKDFNVEKFAGGGMNVYNSYTANYLNMPFLSAENEMDLKMPYMTLRHCPMKEHLNGSCANCPFKDGYTYTMPNGKIMKLKRIKMSSCSFYLTD